MERVPIELRVTCIDMPVPYRRSPHRSRRSGSSHRSEESPLVFSIEWVFPPEKPCFQFQQVFCLRFPNTMMAQGGKVHSGEYEAATSSEIEGKDAHHSLLACNRDTKRARIKQTTQKQHRYPKKAKGWTTNTNQHGHFAFF